jgi:acetate kinase
VVNTGSSSLKLQVLEGDVELPGLSARIADWDGRDVEPIGRLMAAAAAAPIAAIGHRVVHGGADRHGPVLIDDDVVGQIDALSSLAPLHQDRALAGIAAARSVAPDVPQVACFDTSFHATLPDAAATYALPAEWRSRWGLRRFGFHGLSHAYAVARAAELLGGDRDPELRVVSCHLGAGASLCAARGGRSVDTTMGFTPLEGLVMATRAGSVDPGLLLWLITDAGLPAVAVRHGLEHRSGLVGLAGTADMRAVLDRTRAGDPDARLAFEVYVHVLSREVAAMTASLGGLDALVFTGGVGEHAAGVRAAAAARLGYLGVAIDPDANARSGGENDTGPDRDLSVPGAAVTTLVVEAREDIEIARQTRAALAASSAGS